MPIYTFHSHKLAFCLFVYWCTGVLKYTNRPIDRYIAINYSVWLSAYSYPPAGYLGVSEDVPFELEANARLALASCGTGWGVVGLACHGRGAGGRGGGEPRRGRLRDG